MSTLRRSWLPSAATALCVMAHAPAAAAGAASASYSPWAALSAVASPASSAALCGSTATAAAAAGQGQQSSGCVLPATDPVPAPPPQGAAVGAPIEAAGFTAIPLLAGLAVLGGLVAILLAGGDEDDNLISISP